MGLIWWLNSPLSSMSNFFVIKYALLIVFYITVQSLNSVSCHAQQINYRLLEILIMINVLIPLISLSAGNPICSDHPFIINNFIAPDRCSEAIQWQLIAWMRYKRTYVLLNALYLYMGYNPLTKTIHTN